MEIKKLTIKDLDMSMLWQKQCEIIDAINEINKLNPHTNLFDKNGRLIDAGDKFIRNGHVGVVERADSGLWIVVFDDGKIISLVSDIDYNWQCDEQEVIKSY